jgi:predicted DsbA family dithiol-disulfide isomerase
MVFFSLEKLKQNYDVNTQWHAYELRPAGSPPIPPEYRARIEQSRPAFAQRMKQEHGVEIQPGPFGINSRPSLIVEKFAEAQGVGAAFHDAAQRAYWVEGRDLSKNEVLQDLMRQAGLEPNQLETALNDPHYEAEVDADIAQAREFGLEGVPALVFNNTYLITGAQPYAILVRAVEQILTENVGGRNEDQNKD